jgi:hypothetical protein
MASSHMRSPNKFRDSYRLSPDFFRDRKPCKPAIAQFKKGQMKSLGDGMRSERRDNVRISCAALLALRTQFRFSG